MRSVLYLQSATLTAGTADGADHTLVVEPVAESHHAVFVGRVEVDTGNGMETDKVDACLRTLKQFCQGVSVRGVIVESAPHDVFHGEAALMREIVVAQHRENLCDRIGLFDRYQAQAFGVIG